MKWVRYVASQRGSHYDIGLSAGRALPDSIAANVDLFWEGVAAAGLSRDELLACTYEDEARLPSKLREEIRGLAEGSGRMYRELLAYNLYRGGLACDC